MEKLKSAVIGLGRISVMHLNAIMRSPDAELVAVCDIDEEKLNTAVQKYGVNGYLDYEEMLNNEKLDVVHICLPHYLHVPVSLAAFKRGVNVLCEKPMSISYADAVTAVEAAEKANLRYGIIFQCRFNDSSVLVKNAVTSGKLGKILSASSFLTWSRSDDYYSHSDWKGTWDKEGGGVVIDQAIHSIDLINWLVDSPVKSVQSSIFNRHHKKVVVEDTAEGLIEYENGVLYSFYCMNNFAADEPIRLEILCENGKAVFNYDEATITYNNKTVEHVINDGKDEKVAGGKDYWGLRHYAEVQQFYNAVLNREQLKVSGAEALKTQKIICEIYNKGKKYLSD